MKRNLLLKLWMVAFIIGFGAFAKAQTFSDVTTTYGLNSITAGRAQAAWADYDNDGKLEFIITGDKGGLYSAIFKQDGNGVYQDVSATAVPGGLTQTYVSSVAWSDYNNDGFLDFALIGTKSNSASTAYPGICEIYKNNGNGTFTKQTSTDLGVTLQGMNNGSVTWADFNNDGFVDLLVTGKINSGSGSSFPYNSKGADYKYNRLYMNNGDGTFKENTSFTTAVGASGVYHSMSASTVVDYNNDGYLDIFVFGYSSTNYFIKNNGDGTFTNVTGLGISISSIVQAYVGWCNFNNDLYPDVFVTYSSNWSASATNMYTGSSNATPFSISNPASFATSTGLARFSFADFNNDGTQDMLYTDNNLTGTAATKVYSNGGAGAGYAFTDVASTLGPTFPGYCGGSAQWLDVNNDGKLDIYINGATTGNGVGQASLFLNNSTTANTAPAAPSNLTSSVTGSNVKLNWNPSIDAETPQNSMTYELRIGTSPNGYQIICPLSNLSTGLTKVPQAGKLTENDRTIGYTLKNLRGGKYYWSIHAIDGGLLGGAWATEGSFEVAAVTPSTQASTLNAANVANTTADISWANGNGYKRAVFISENTSSSPTLTTGQSFTANTTFGQGSTAGTGWYCVYNGTGSSVSVSGLTEKTNYKVVVVEYDGYPGYENYNSTESTNATTFSTPFSITTQASSIVVLAASYSFDVSWTTGLTADGYGAKRAVFISLGNTGTPTVNDGQTYTANAKFGQGSAAGTGWYCVYNGTGSSTTITGLSINTEYILAVYEYNGDPGKERYLTSTALDNPFSKFTSNKLNQIITFDPLASKTTLDAPFTLTATGGDSGNPIVYTSSNTSVATISGNTVTIVGAGTTDITATQAGSTGYSDATPVIRTLTVNKVAQAINFAALPTNIKYLDPAFQVSATGGASGNPVVFTSSDPTKATVSGNTVTIVGGGSVDIIANQTGDAIYADAPEVRRTLTIAKLPQVIGFDNLPDKTYLNAPFTLTATGGDSGNPVTYSSSNAAVATISNNICTITGAGSVNITASQAGNNNYEAATNVVRSLKVNQATQSITFDLLPVMNANDGTLTLTATASSGLPITYTSSDLLVATISGNTVTIKKAGTINITAAQAGNTSFKAATSAVRALVINKLSQTLTFDALATKLPTETDFQLNAAVTSGRKITYTSSNPNVATIVGANMDYVHIVGNGTTFITASQPGDSIYLAALPIQHVFMVGTTGVKELSEKEVRIFPNPVSETLNVNFAKSMAQTTISIYSNNGQQLTSVNADQTANVIYMGNLAKGTYILKIVSPDGTLVKQIIKK